MGLIPAYTFNVEELRSQLKQASEEPVAKACSNLTEAQKRIGCGLVGLLIIASPLVYRWWQARREHGEFREQLRLARAEGLPTTADEFRVLIPPARPEENAATLYRQLPTLLKEAGGKVYLDEEISRLRKDLIWAPSESAKRQAFAIVGQYRYVFDVIEKAAKMPRCWFNRNWEDGYAVLMPELTYMKSGARLLDLRATFAIAEGRTKDAFRDLRMIARIADHAGQEPTMISGFVRDALHLIRLDTLSGWSYRRSDPLVLAELQRAIREMPEPNVKREWSGELFSTLSLVELIQTETGREKLGFKPEDSEPTDLILPVLLSQSKARIEMVRAQRSYWAGLVMPLVKRRPLLDNARQKYFQALLAFPPAGRVVASSTDDPIATRLEDFAARKMQYQALCRILAARRKTGSVAMSDLKSPFDGKPLTYTIGSRQIVIEVSGYEYDTGRPRNLKVPSDDIISRRPP